MLAKDPLRLGTDCMNRIASAPTPKDRDLSVRFMVRDVLLSEPMPAGKTLGEGADLDWTRAVFLRVRRCPRRVNRGAKSASIAVR